MCIRDRCTHISAYLLKIEPDTVFGRRAPDGVPGDDEAADFYLACVDELAARGYRQYEISNFAQPGFEGRHNLLYWDCRDYLGIGPSAHSCMSGKRFFTPRGTDAFLRADAVYTPDGDCTAQDYIMLRLRLAEGLSLAKLQSRFGVSLTPAQTAFCRSLAQNGLARFDGETLSLIHILQKLYAATPFTMSGTTNGVTHAARLCASVYGITAMNHAVPSA